MKLRAVATIVLLLCLAVPTWAQEPQPKITGETNVKPYTLVRLSVDVPINGSVEWDVWPFDAKVDIASTEDCILQFVAPPGEYVVQVKVYVLEGNAIKSQRARVKVTVGGDGPGPKPPEPGPGPNPPVPPVPDDPLAKDLATLYRADPSTTKIPDLLLLVELYRQAADLAKSDSVTTLGQLAKQVADAGQTLLPRTRLTALRERIGKYVAGEFGEEDKPLTSEERAKAATVYARVSKALQQIGGGQ